MIMGKKCDRFLSHFLHFVNLSKGIIMKNERRTQKMAKNNDREVRIDRDAKEFAKITFKKYKKEDYNSDYSKKELKKLYFIHLVELMPEAINFCVKSSHIQTDEVQRVKTGCYEKFINDDFLSKLKKMLKKEGGDEIENIKLFPIVAKDIFEETQKENKRLLAENPSAKTYDLTLLAEVVQIINKKRIKKFTKNEIDETLAFDICCVIPTDKCLTSSQSYRIKQFYEVLYESAKGKAVPFHSIMKVVVKEQTYIPAFILFALLERKDRYGNLNDSQKALYVDITNWALKTLEGLPKDVIRHTIDAYVNNRKRAEGQGKDSRRRYDLQSLSEVDYPKIVKVMNTMISANDGVKKYL